MSRNINIIATGDSFISSRMGSHVDMSDVMEVIDSGDIKFTNFEMTTPDDYKYPSSVSGGTWASAPKEVMEDIKTIGFNCVSWANNHTLDFLHEGLISTKKNLEEMDILHSGAGMDMGEAGRPKYINVNGCKVALVSMTTTFDDTWIAGDKRHDGPGRPGVNGIRTDKIFQVSRDELRTLKELSKKIGINYERELDIKEGFLEEDDDKFHFGVYKFEEDNTEENMFEQINEVDLERNLKNIKTANNFADIVLVSIHSHEMYKTHKELPAKFLERLARKSVEAGADSVICHGPHILRGIEIYMDSPIFYSLGNFIFQNDHVQFLPSDFYEKYGLDSDNNIEDAINARNMNGTRGLGTDFRVWESVMAKWNLEKRMIELIPIDLGFKLNDRQKGWPRLTGQTGVIERLAKLSEQYGTVIDIVDGRGRLNF